MEHWSNEQADEATIRDSLKAVSKQWQRIFRKFEGGVMDTKQLTPVEIKRDETGSWIHPEFLKYLNSLEDDAEFITNEDWRKFKSDFNVETVTFWMESSVSSDDWESMMDDCDISKWDPIAPHGFFLIDIGFSEDDAYAIFARPKRVSEVA